MQWLLIGFVACSGVLNTIQAGSNSTLNKVLSTPLWSAAIVFSVALASTVTAALISGQRLSGNAMTQVPWWGWIGGVFGSLYVVGMMMAANKVGAAVFMAVTVTAAIITSLAMDHFGFMGFEVHRAGIGRLAGGAAIICGLGLIAKY